jgi:hypothetical protein
VLYGGNYTLNLGGKWLTGFAADAPVTQSQPKGQAPANFLEVVSLSAGLPNGTPVKYGDTFGLSFNGKPIQMAGKVFMAAGGRLLSQQVFMTQGTAVNPGANIPWVVNVPRWKFVARSPKKTGDVVSVGDPIYLQADMTTAPHTGIVSSPSGYQTVFNIHYYPDTNQGQVGVYVGGAGIWINKGTTGFTIYDKTGNDVPISPLHRTPVTPSDDNGTNGITPEEKNTKLITRLVVGSVIAMMLIGLIMAIGSSERKVASHGSITPVYISRTPPRQ